ncbi:MAG: diguanylate cyclase, partial [Magnetococcales bacterium]|nr:diguanylate cyclase [Magnetococcales bacterium]
MNQPLSQDMEEALPRYSIHTTLYLFFFTVAIIIVLSCGILLWSNQRVATAAQEMLVMDMTGSKSLTALRINLSQLEEDVLSVHHGQDHGHRQAALDAAERATLHLEEADSLISLLCQGSERHQHMESHGSPSPFEELEPPLSQLNQILGEIAGWLNRIAQDELEFQDIQGGERRLQQWISVELPPISKKLHQLQYGMENHLEASIGQIIVQTKKNDRLGWIISIIALMAALLLGWLMVTRINHAISVLQHSVTALEENRFTGKMHFSLPFSELAQLAQAFNRMAKQLDATLISREHLDRIIWSVSESIFVLDEQGEIHLANQAAKSLLGAENSRQSSGHIGSFFKEGDPAGHFLRHCLEQHQEFSSVEGVWPNSHGEDRLVSLSLTCLPSSLSSQQAGSMVLVVRDITHRKQMEDQLRHLASHDLLTGLPNRSLFMDRLQQAKKRANRQQTLLGLFFLSIDNIKNFNDTFGHGVGDWILQRVAQVCQNTLRHSDTVARFGGNEFILLVEDAHTVRSLEELMLKLVQRRCDQPAE